MKYVVSLLLVSAPAAAGTISENDQVVKHDCAKDGNLSIDGNNARVTLVGTCVFVIVGGNGATITGASKRVGISGNDNTVDLSAVGTLVVSGNTNKVTWKKSLTPNNKPPAIRNTGTGNTIGPAK